MATPQHSIQFPNESAAYRASRNQLLFAEVELRKKLEEVAALRRTLPLGGELLEDYTFEEGSAGVNDTAPIRKIRLSELFAPGKDTLVLYSFMFGPNMASACTS